MKVYDSLCGAKTTDLNHNKTGPAGKEVCFVSEENKDGGLINGFLLSVSVASVTPRTL